MRRLEPGDFLGAAIVAFFIGSMILAFVAWLINPEQ